MGVADYAWTTITLEIKDQNYPGLGTFLSLYQFMHLFYQLMHPPYQFMHHHSISLFPWAIHTPISLKRRCCHASSYFHTPFPSIAYIVKPKPCKNQDEDIFLQRYESKLMDVIGFIIVPLSLLTWLSLWYLTLVIWQTIAKALSLSDPADDIPCKYYKVMVDVMCLILMTDLHHWNT